MVKMTGRGPAASSRQTGQCGRWAETWRGVTSDYHLNTTITNKGEQLVDSFLLPQNQKLNEFSISI